MRNLQFISGLKFGHCQNISQCGNVLHRCVCSLCRRSSGYSPTLPCWIYCTQCYYSSRSIFECKSFRFSVHGASLCSVACALSTCGLSLVIVFGSAYSARLPRSIPLFGGLCFVHLGAQSCHCLWECVSVSCIVKATVLRQLPAWPPTLLLLCRYSCGRIRPRHAQPTTRTFEPRSSPSVRPSTNEKATPTLLFARTQIFR